MIDSKKLPNLFFPIFMFLAHTGAFVVAVFWLLNLISPDTAGTMLVYVFVGAAILALLESRRNRQDPVGLYSVWRRKSLVQAS